MINDKKIDYKIVNLAILALIVYLMYHTGNLWIGIFNKFIAIIKPFVIGFAIAYSVYPITLKLRKRGLPKSLAIFIVIITLLFLFIFMGYIISTTCVSQISALFNSVSEFVSELSSFNLKINIRSLQEMLNENFKSILDGLTKYVSDGAINLVSSSIASDVLAGAGWKPLTPTGGSFVYTNFLYLNKEFTNKNEFHFETYDPFFIFVQSNDWKRYN